MNDNSIPTVHHARLQQLRSFDVAFSAENHSTLNEFFNLNAGDGVPTLSPPNDNINLYPVIKYMGVGVYPISDDTDYLPPRHRCTDGRLFKPMPFVVRASGNPLNNNGVPGEPQRNDYRMALTVTGSPVTLGDSPANQIVLPAGYIYYFIKTLNIGTISPEHYEIIITDGVVSSTGSGSLTLDNLFDPMPVDISNVNLYNVSGAHRAVQTIVSMLLNSVDINELVAAVTLIMGNSNQAAITEFALISGYDKDTDPNNLEITHAQVCNFIGTNIPLQGMPNAVDLTYALTASLPHPSNISEP